MLSWKSFLRLPSVSSARLLWGWSVLAVVFAAPCGHADEPMRVEAEVQAAVPLGSTIEVTTGGYPPANTQGWFAFETGNDEEIFSIDESTGTIRLSDPNKLNAREHAERILFVEHGRADETEAQTVRRKFLRAAGLTDREISRRLGLVTRYEIRLQIKPRHSAPAFPPRPLHFFWPAESETISEVRAEDSDPGDELRYRLVSQEPANWIEIDPLTGVLRLTTEGASARMSETSWRGIVEATDGFGLKAATTVWVTEPLALPTLSIPSLKMFWPGESLAFIRALAFDGLGSITSIKNSWRFDPALLANQIPPSTTASTTAASAEETSQAAAYRDRPPAVESATPPAAPLTTWGLALLAVALASLWHILSRYRQSQKLLKASPSTSEEYPMPDTPPLTPELRVIPEPPNCEAASSQPTEEVLEWEKVLVSSGNAGAASELVSVSPPRAHVDLPIAAVFQRDPLAILLEEADSSAPSTEELERLLSMLDDQLQGETTESANAPTPQPTELPRPKQEANPELSVSEYMCNLLSKHSKPDSEEPDLAETPADPNPRSVQQSAGVPKPVFSYDRETTRSQLEQLRATSNRTAANAIRKAASRRLRRNLIRWGLFVLVAIGIGASRLFLFD